MAGSIVIPLITIFIIILITGDRMNGLQYFTIPSFLIVHLLFAYFYLKKKLLIKLILGILAATVAAVFILLPILFDFSFNLDIYGFWDGIIFFTLGTVGTWEAIYQIDKVINKNSE
jgi:drug/metabolite transporter (DMT)-like permease